MGVDAAAIAAKLAAMASRGRFWENEDLTRIPANRGSAPGLLMVKLTRLPGVIT
jgi:hypothetical protein